MKALEGRAEIKSAAASLQKAFRERAEIIGKMSGKDILWHDAVEIWGTFGNQVGKGGSLRAWNAFGQKPYACRSNMIVEINHPPQGIDYNLQGVFAADKTGQIWLLHQGRMKVSGTQVSELDFIAATSLKPIRVSFSDGSGRNYHKVAKLSAPSSVVQESIAAFVAQCARARQIKLAAAASSVDLTQAQSWERGLSPEAIGTFDIAPRDGATGRRIHGEIWRALSSQLKHQKVPHSNDRVSQYGPDLYTYGVGPKVLFEIKSSCTAQSIFEGVGQLHIYDRLLGGGYRKVLVIPKGLKKAMMGPISGLNIDTVEFDREGKKIAFDRPALSRCLGKPTP